MKALDRKLLRDLGRLRGQVVTIALVIACGIAQLVTFVTLYRSLEASRDTFYADTRFADVFVHLDRAPRSILPRLAEIPGVARVNGRSVGDFRLELPNVTVPLLGRFVSLDGPPDARLDEPFIDDGRTVTPGSSNEVVVSELFAHARDLHPGGSIVAVLGGHAVTLRVVGIATSPEYVIAVNPRSGFPDASTFGIFWMDGDALSKAMGESGEIDDVVLTVAAGADEANVIAAVDRELEPYGGTGAIPRAQQGSARSLDSKIEQYRSMSKFVPFVFLGVAAFLLNLVLSRIVGAQREQIATLKALGYGTGALARHYALLALAICGLGGGLGVLLGLGEGQLAVRSLLRFFNLPVLVFRFDAAAAIAGVIASFVAGLLGAFGAVRRTIRLPAAEAMQPEPPESFKPTFIERLELDRLLGVAGRMVLRDVERHPVRLALSALSVAMATSIMLVGTTMTDSLERAITNQFTRVEREDLTVAFDRPKSAEAVRELEHVPGVVHAEAQRAVGAKLTHGWRERDLAILGVPRNPQLRRLEDARGEPIRPPTSGVLLSRPLAQILDVRAGDDVDAEVLEAGRLHLPLRVEGFVDDFSGLSAYMDLPELERRLGEPPTVSGAFVSVARGDLPAVTARIDRLPGVASYSEPALDRAQFETQMSDSLRAMTVMLAIFASIIAVGMVFNNARIALAMRSRDLATLRILGFTRGEVATVLLGEQAIQLVLGIALGLPLGYGLGAAALGAIPPELFRVPPVLAASSLVWAVTVVLVSGIGCALWVRREADRLDLVSVLKARD
ncbi:MAG TPA: FtsX-like permease family protein [Polyangiaceae bacterium]